MSKNRRFIDSVAVGKPCSEDWNEMTGTDKVRFCSHCVKSVNNLSEMTRKEATRLVRASGGNLCIRYIANPVTRRPMFAPQLAQITRRAPQFAAGVMTASLAASSSAYAQDNPQAPSPTAVEIEQSKDRDTNKAVESTKNVGSIMGNIVDPNGAVVPNAFVKIISIDGGKTTNSNDVGDYRFDNLAAGNYRLEVESNYGFKKFETQVSVPERGAAKADVALEIGFELTVNVTLDIEETNVLSGVVASVEYSTPLTRAVADESIEEVRELIARGAKVNGKDENYDGVTPLFIAVETGNVEIVEMLLRAGAKVDARDGEKQTPLMRLDEDATPELLDVMLQYGAKIDRADKQGVRPLIAAARVVTSEVLKAMIAAGADIHAADKEGQTALMAAAAADEIENVRVLLVSGSDVNRKNDEGKTAYDLTSDEEIEKLLIQAGASVEVEEEVVAPGAVR